MKADLFAEFPYTTAQEWHARISKDLKGRLPEDMFWSPDGILSIDPYVHAETVVDIMPPLPAFGQLGIGESFDIADAHESNLLIRDALNFGTEALHLTCTQDADWPVLLNGIHLPMVHLSIDVLGDDATISSLIEFAGGADTLHDLSITIFHPHTIASGLRTIAHPVSYDKIVPGLTEMLMYILDADRRNPELLAQRDIAVETGMHYLVEIARLRAVRILWSRIADHFGFKISKQFAIEAHSRITGDDPYSDMIRNTTMAMAAVLGGADRVMLRPTSGGPHTTTFHRRIARNIHHLLKYESKLMEAGTDPLAGAYYLEKLVGQIVEGVWGRMTVNIDR